MKAREKINELVTEGLAGKVSMVRTLQQINKVVNDETYWQQEGGYYPQAAPQDEPQLGDPGQDSRSLLDIAIDFLPDSE